MKILNLSINIPIKSFLFAHIYKLIIFCNCIVIENEEERFGQRNRWPEKRNWLEFEEEEEKEEEETNESKKGQGYIPSGTKRA